MRKVSKKASKKARRKAYFLKTEAELQKTKETRHKCSLFRSRMIRRKSILHSP